VIFELFDFNEIESLSLIDCECLLECCIMSACKLHNIKPDTQNLTELNSYLNTTLGPFDEEKQMNFSQLLKHCIEDDCVKSFLKLFNIPEISKKSIECIDLFEESPSKRLLDANIAQSRQCISKHLLLIS